MTPRSGLTPALQNILRVLVQAKEPHTYASLAAMFDRPERSLHNTVAELRQVLEGTGVSIQVKKRGREHRARITIVGDPKTIAALTEQTPAEGVSCARVGRPVTLPSICGVPYAYTIEGHLMIGGEIQPVRIA